ncbi:hypothetical protein Tco_0929081 [Tanacetum coccineum]
MPTKTELELEQTQQGVSDEVLVRIKGNIIVILHSDDGNPTSANIKQALRHEVFKLKNIKKDGYKSLQDERYEHVGPEVISSQKGVRLQDDEEMMFD